MSSGEVDALLQRAGSIVRWPGCPQRRHSCHCCRVLGEQHLASKTRSTQGMWGGLVAPVLGEQHRVQKTKPTRGDACALPSAARCWVACNTPVLGRQHRGRPATQLRWEAAQGAGGHPQIGTPGGNAGTDERSAHYVPYAWGHSHPTIGVYPCARCYGLVDLTACLVHVR